MALRSDLRLCVHGTVKTAICQVKKQAAFGKTEGRLIDLI
jgi:hypothetical protein